MVKAVDGNGAARGQKGKVECQWQRMCTMTMRKIGALGAVYWQGGVPLLSNLTLIPFSRSNLLPFLLQSRSKKSSRKLFLSFGPSFSFFPVTKGRQTEVVRLRLSD